MSAINQEEAFEKILVANLQRVLDFLKYAEAKNGALLTFASAWVLAIVSLVSSGRPLPLGLDDVVPYGIAALSVAGVCAIASFVPQVDPFKFQKDKNRRERNFLFFGDIAASDNIDTAIRDRYYPPHDRIFSQTYIQDLISQISINSRIARRKLAFFQYGIYAVAFGAALVFGRLLGSLAYLVLSQ